MKLHFNAYKISIWTDQGPCGAEIKFADGLNVVRAENTSGKSSLINGIYYALGLELIVGKTGIEATKPVLHSGGDYQGKDFQVIESFVELEIMNGQNEVVTVRRYIRGEQDTRLVVVVHGPRLTGPEKATYKTDPYYVQMEGSAQRERGFHYFLAEFLDLKLPRVRRSGRNEVPLYMECVIPLMFIEQVRGWSGIQASLKQGFGIKDVSRLSFEYILGLGVIENEKKRIDVQEELSRIRESWTRKRAELSSLAHQAVGRAIGIPPNPVADLADEPWIAIVASDNEVPLDDVLVAKRTKYIGLNSETDENRSDNPQLEAELEAQESYLLSHQAALSKKRSALVAEEDEIRTLAERESFIRDDIKRNNDIARLMKYGASNDLLISAHLCPTCNQSVADSLLPTGSAVMSVEDNIRFLKSEVGAICLLKEGCQERIGRMRASVEQESTKVSNLRATIRDLRSDLLQSQSTSVAVIREQVQIQEEISRLEHIRDEFNAQVEQLRDIAAKWVEAKANQAELPKDYFSDGDRRILNSFSDNFYSFIQAFGYRSSDTSRLSISEENYKPVCDDFEVSFGASASDNIRLIWAYTLSLLVTSMMHNGNHWGVIIFDEPEQQKMGEASSDALYKAIAEISPDEFQVILATSASVEKTSDRLQGLPYKLIEFGDKVIRPRDDIENDW
jgi:hypothetical protein